MTRGIPDFVAAAAVVFASILACECITGGEEATAHSRPYMASLQLNKDSNYKHECGGFLVAEQWVMTAAHCVLEGKDGMRIVLGAHSLTEADDLKQNFAVAEVFSHTEFNRDNYDNDIALLKLDRAALLSDAVKTLQLQRDGGADPQTDDVVSTAGWGSRNNMGSRPDKLQEVDIKVMRRNLCGRSDYYGKGFTDNLMCASEKRKDTCDVGLLLQSPPILSPPGLLLQSPPILSTRSPPPVSSYPLSTRSPPPVSSYPLSTRSPPPVSSSSPLSTSHSRRRLSPPTH
ncbi:complement factor D isoform X3 [Anguilla rostrata]|uniref:complement factor D isoform X3 n=1 Tax=Anguilla rostrata TaxID=7938 RepID=UPI0030D42272